MPAIQNEQTIAANTTIPSIFNGSAFEYSRGRNLLSLGVTAAATGTLTTITSGADLILEESATYIKTQFPIVPDEMFYNDVMEPMDRLRVQIRNGTGAGIVCRGIALMTPLQ